MSNETNKRAFDFSGRTNRIKTNLNEVNDIYRNLHHCSTQLLMNVNFVSFCLN